MRRSKKKKHSEQAADVADAAESGAAAEPSDATAAPAPVDGAPTGPESSGSTAEQGLEPEEQQALRARLLRLQADFDNYRKRTLREREELRVHANEEIMLELLPVLDHLDLGLAAAKTHETDETFVNGLQMVADQLLDALKKFGLTPLDAEGEAFDPTRHEAISYLPTEDVAEGIVVSQTRRGYMLGKKLLRAVPVVVSSGPSAGADTAEPAVNGEPDRS